MFRSEVGRTGIDLGSSCVKLVRGSGISTLSEISHVGFEPWEGDGSEKDVERAARALRDILDRLHLNRNRLGRIAVSVGGMDTCLREVTMPPLSPEELRRALPYESRQHLDLAGMEDPIIDCQHLGTVAANGEGEASQIRVLFAGAPRERRDFPIRVLARIGLEPDVVDFETLAALNELLANHEPPADAAFGLLDLGARRHDLHITTATGGLFTRLVGEVASDTSDTSATGDEGWRSLASNIRSTFTYYRGRRHTDVTRLFVGGAGAGLDLEWLETELGVPVSEHDPFSRIGHSAVGKSAKGFVDRGFVVACGLCRWWDDRDV